MIYIVEDDANIRELESYALKSGGFETSAFEEGKTFMKALKSKTPDLVILDIMLPGQDGLEILKEIRLNSGTKNIPVILVTAKSSEIDKVKGLDQGADDYITKPFGILEMVSRVKALLRRTGNEIDNNVYQCGKIVLNDNTHEVFAEDENIVLTFKEYELLKYLLKNRDIVLSRDKLLTNIWGYDFVGESRTVDMHVTSLRKKLGEQGKYIKTVRNVGYKIGET